MADLWIPIDVPATFTDTTQTVLGNSGILVNETTIFKLGSSVQVQLGAFMKPAASETVELLLAYQHRDERLTNILGTLLSVSQGATNRFVKQTSPFVDVTQFARFPEPFILRVLGRVTGGTGTVAVAFAVVRIE